MGDMGWGRLSRARGGGIRGILLTPWSQASSTQLKNKLLL